MAFRDLLFSDEVVTPTELARQVRRITQTALHHPVTVHRTDGDLALLSRDRVSELTAASAAIEDVVDFGRNILWILRGKGRPSPGWAWLQLFGPDDVADFMDEYLSAIEQALSGTGDWDLPAAVLDEWKKSAQTLSHQPLLAELASFRGLVSAEEAALLTASDLRARLAAAIENSDPSHAV